MRLVLVIRSLGIGGSERHAVVLAAGLTRRGHRVHVVQLVPGNAFGEELAAAGVETTSLGLRGRGDLPRLARLLPLLQRLRPDVLHGLHVESNLVCLAAAPLVGGAAVVWGYRTSSHGALAGDRVARALERLHRALAPRATAAIANSEAGAAAARSEGARVTTIRTGVDLERFRPDPAGAARVRRELGVAPEAPLLGAVARLDPVKGYELFLDAAALFARERPDARFACVGPGEPGYRAALVARAEALGLAGRVIWAGARSDLAPVYSALDASTLVTAAEGTSNAVAEALACGVPCVVADVGDLAWLVGDPRLVVERTPAAVAAGWRHALAVGDDARAAWRRRVAEECSAERMVDETERLLLALAQRPRRGASG